MKYQLAHRLLGSAIFIALLIGAARGQETANAEECPVQLFSHNACQTCTTGFFASDRLVTVDDAEFPELHQGERGSIALERNEKYLIGWQSVNADQSLDNEIYVLRDRDHDGGNEPTTDCPLPLTQSSDGAFHESASVAIGLRTPIGVPPPQRFLVSWTSQPLSPLQAPSLRKLDSLNFLLFPEDFPFVHAFSVAGFTDLPIPPAGGNLDVGPSSGLSAISDSVALSNSLRSLDDRGLIYELETGGTLVDRVRCCDDASTCPTESCAVQFEVWQPCIAMQNDGNGRYCIVFAEKSEPGAAVARFNIALRVFDDAGISLASIDRDNAVPLNAVNDPTRDPPDSNQLSPAVDFDSCGNIAVTWVGPSPPGSDATLNVYARRLFFDDSNNSLHFLSDQFIVNADDGWHLGNDPDLIHPTVAMTAFGGAPDDLRRFFIAWNANTSIVEEGQSLIPTHFQWGVRGQLFSPKMETVGPNIDVSPNPIPNQAFTFDGFDRTLAESAQHTIDYGNKRRKVASWTSYNPDVEEEQVHDVWVTILEATLEVHFVSQGLVCEKGDFDGDGLVTLSDVDPFVAVLLDDATHLAAYADICPADVNADGLANGKDVSCFTALILGMPVGVCEDHSFACAPPPGGESGGEGFASGGSNEPESGGQDEGDSGDSDEENSTESDSGGAGVLADCNANGVDDWTEIESGEATDCDADGYLDECEMHFGFIISSDCNDNGVPDECDLDAGLSSDVNLNGYPDECDAAEQIDLTPRTWPDDAEGTSELLDFGDYDAQNAFYKWCGRQLWGPDATLDGSPISGSVQFHRLIEKRRELGLPLSNPYGLMLQSESP